MRLDFDLPNIVTKLTYKTYYRSKKILDQIMMVELVEHKTIDVPSFIKCE